jgi:hypothetical protein
VTGVIARAATPAQGGDAPSARGADWVRTFASMFMSWTSDRSRVPITQTGGRNLAQFRFATGAAAACSGVEMNTLPGWSPWSNGLLSDGACHDVITNDLSYRT